MCGRVLYNHKPNDLLELLELVEPGDLQAAPDGRPDFAPTFNLAPTDPILTVSAWGRVEVTRWGLSLSNPRAKGFNARGENLGRLYGHTARALVVVSGFYEWRTLGPKRKQPFLVERADGAPLILAGIRDAEGCAIVTTKATGLVATLHDRMPVVLERADLRRWLLPDTRPQSLVAAASADALRMHPVANDVGDVRNNHPGLAACVEEAPADPRPKKQLDLF